MFFLLAIIVLWFMLPKIVLAKGGGGGGSGKVDYPKEMKLVHQLWLGYHRYHDMIETSPEQFHDVLTEMEIAMDPANNPFSSTLPYDPTDSLQTAQSRFDQFDAIVSSMGNGTTDYTAWLTYAFSVYKDAALSPFSEDGIDDDVDAYEIAQQTEAARALADFSAGMAASGAIMSSAYVMGKAAMLSEHVHDVTKFRANLRLNVIKDRNTFFASIVQDQGRMRMERIQAEQVASQFQADLLRVGIVANKEFLDSSIDQNVKMMRWNLDTFQYGSNMLAGIGGGVVNTKATGSGGATPQSVIGGALGGAGLGAALANNQAWGAALGALAGGVMGAM